MTSVNDAENAAEIIDGLCGTWSGMGKGGFPTISPFEYREELIVHRSDEARLWHYVQRTWKITPQGEAPSHQETGFITVDDAGVIEILNAQGSDRVEVLRGGLSGSAQQWELEVEAIVQGHDSRMQASRRKLQWSGESLQYEMYMATNRVEQSTFHLQASLGKTTGPGD